VRHRTSGSTWQRRTCDTSQSGRRRRRRRGRAATPSDHQATERLHAAHPERPRAGTRLPGSASPMAASQHGRIAVVLRRLRQRSAGVCDRTAALPPSLDRQALRWAAPVGNPEGAAQADAAANPRRTAVACRDPSGSDGLRARTFLPGPCANARRRTLGRHQRPARLVRQHSARASPRSFAAAGRASMSPTRSRACAPRAHRARSSTWPPCRIVRTCVCRTCLRARRPRPRWPTWSRPDSIAASRATPVMPA